MIPPTLMWLLGGSSRGSPIRVQERISSHIVSRTDVPLKRGAYDIYSEGSIRVSDEPWIYRLTSHIATRRDDRFRHEISHRDRKCVISGLSLPEALVPVHNFIGSEAWFTDMDDATGSSKINSAQNGFLLQGAVTQLFDQYLVTVNPDDGYMVVVFYIDLLGLDGRILDPGCRNPTDPHSVSDQVRRWHYRQPVLANVRRGGEPLLEHDFTPGTDMVGEILAGPYARERFELEIAARLREVS
ncbi:hypothetical protein HOY82DRAFT_583341 [Tuber indicum]|nr:hypothetical protein HOY82DRAFT_583341 [Tuber indicum]